MILTKLIVMTYDIKCCQEDYAAPCIKKRNCSLTGLILGKYFIFSLFQIY